MKELKLFPRGRNSIHIQWIHDRIVNVYGENENVDFLHRLRDIISEMKQSEDGFIEYMEFTEKIHQEKKDGN